jgi:hypothetical protein
MQLRQQIVDTFKQFGANAEINTLLPATRQKPQAGEKLTHHHRGAIADRKPGNYDNGMTIPAPQ